MAAEAIVQLRQVSKSFGERQAVSHLDLAIAPGQIFGLIGPSGSGKTTTIRLLLGILEPDHGDVLVMGRDPRHFSTGIRERIGYAPQGFFLYPTLTVYENARFVAGLYGIGLAGRRKRIRQVLTFLELWDARRRLTRNLSGGEQRRLALACALIHRPDLLVVDEPTGGLDPVLRSKIWAFLTDLRNQGITVFVTTQLIDETARCDNVAVMAEGRLLAVGSPESLRRKAIGGEVVDIEAPQLSSVTVRDLRQLPEVKRVRWKERGGLQIVVEDAATATPAITAALHDHGEVVEAVRPIVPTFDEVFKHIVGADEEPRG